MMTGVYDFACTPEMTEQTADKIRNAECIIMKGIGHFPMCENPEVFKKYLMPVLDRLLEYARDRRPAALTRPQFATGRSAGPRRLAPLVAT